ncbi:MAG: GntR family transcriptional regulator [Thermodesulfobacteriota bacterium]
MSTMTKKDLTQEVFLELRSRILNFKLLPGVRVSDKEMAEKFGLSRTPVREALIRLAEQGLLEARHNRGFTVKVFSTREVQDLYTLRATLEEMAVDLTTKNLDREKAQTLRDILAAYPALMKDQNLAGFNDADEAFHRQIADYSHNALLAQTLKSLQGQVRLARLYDHLRPVSFMETYREHTQILEHMTRGEAARARKAMARHILNSMKIIIKILEGRETPPEAERRKRLWQGE